MTPAVRAAADACLAAIREDRLTPQLQRAYRIACAEMGRSPSEHATPPLPAPPATKRKDRPHPLVEYRYFDDGSLDEIVTYDARDPKRCVFHLEYMDKDSLFMSVDLPDGRVAMWLDSKKRIKINAEVEMYEREPLSPEMAERVAAAMKEEG